MSDTAIPNSIRDFLGEPTPDAWLAAALADVGLLINDHANCEKKAASTAMSMMFRYADRTALAGRMSRLARAWMSLSSKRALARFEAALTQVLQELAQDIVRDGEGATSFIEVAVRGARSEKDADRVAMAICDSMLSSRRPSSSWAASTRAWA